MGNYLGKGCEKASERIALKIPSARIKSTQLKIVVIS